MADAGEILTAGALNALTPHGLKFTGTKTVTTGLGSETVVDTMAVVVDDGAIDYSIAAGVVTLNDAGIYLVGLRFVFAASGAGTGRMARLSASTLAEPARAVAPPLTGIGSGCGCSEVLNVPAGETFTTRARQDSGGNLDVTCQLSIAYLSPPP